MGESADPFFLEELKVGDYRMPIAKAIAAGDAKRAEARTQEAMRGAVDLFASMMRPGDSSGRAAVPVRRRARS